MAQRYAVDTNVLLRLSHRNHPQHSLITTAMRRLVGRDVELCFTPQNVAEFWNVSTRPLDRNGFGLSIDETEVHIQSIERTMTLLPETEQVYPTGTVCCFPIMCVEYRSTTRILPLRLKCTA